MEYVKLAVACPETTGLMFGGLVEFNESLAKIATEAYQGLVSIIENGIKAGIYKNINVEELTMNTWAMVHGLAMFQTGSQAPPGCKGSQAETDDLTRRLCKNLLHGILK